MTDDFNHPKDTTLGEPTGTTGVSQHRAPSTDAVSAAPEPWWSRILDWLGGLELDWDD